MGEGGAVTRRTVLKAAAVTVAAVAVTPRLYRMSDGVAEALDATFEGWLCRQASPSDDGAVLSDPRAAFSPAGWMNALVPGTVLASLVAAERVPDPYFGLANDELLIDAGDAGGLEAYTFWYRAAMRPPPAARRSDARTFLDLRGINYTADVWVNGINVTAAAPLIGMFMRHRLDVTDLVRPGRRNVLAIRVHPPDPPGQPAAGKSLFEPAGTSCQVASGPKEIGRNVVNQVSAGWDFWQPVRDRNTGLWDDVTLTVTGPVLLAEDPRLSSVITWAAPGDADGATVTASVAVHNTSTRPIEVSVAFFLDEQSAEAATVVGPGATETVAVSIDLRSPQLWWPSGYGPNTCTTRA